MTIPTLFTKPLSEARYFVRELPPGAVRIFRNRDRLDVDLLEPDVIDWLEINVGPFKLGVKHEKHADVDDPCFIHSLEFDYIQFESVEDAVLFKLFWQ